MTPPLFALYATCLLCMSTVDVTANKRSSSSHLLLVNLGEDVTLKCFSDKTTTTSMFYWYKQKLGQRPKLVSKFYKHNPFGTLHGEFENNPRIQLDVNSEKNHLKILNVQISDSATYYCLSSYTYVYDFLESITLSVQGSGLNIQASVHQSGSETIQPGGSVTLNCTVHTGTCNGEHSVYWFKESGESGPGIIYTHGGRNSQCEGKPDTQTQTCVYNLPMKNLNLSHAGTYYCAVASCGQILFGNGIKLDFEDEENSMFLVNFLSGALAFTTVLTVFLTVFLACTAYRVNKADGCQCTDSQARSADASATNAEVHRDADDLSYAALRENKGSSSRRQRYDMSECVYSSVRQ